MWRNSAERYGLITKCLHWSVAVLIFALIVLGWYMVDLTYFDRWYNASLAWHKALGLLVLTLGVSLVSWKLISRSPPYPSSIPRWQQLAASAVHHVLLLMMILLPLTGYLISTSAGKAVDIFGWFVIPPVIEVDTALRDLAIKIHFWCAYGTGLLALAHAGAALKHQFIDRDGVLSRMGWG
jgi:cytochrome b561